MRACGSAALAFSRLAAEVSATATMSNRVGPGRRYAGTCPRSLMKPKPTTAPRRIGGAPRSVIVLRAEVRDGFLAHHPAQRVLQLHELDEEIVLRVQVGRGHRALEVKAEPLLRALQVGALGEIH